LSKNGIEIATIVKEEDGAIAFWPAAGAKLPPVGSEVIQQLDRGKRFGYKRIHTTIHILSVTIPLPVTGWGDLASQGPS
jgi:Ser-tRNA(Ala) deacylase AlaX